MNFNSQAADADVWNVIWQDDFGVEEDSVVRDFADPNMSVPGHRFIPSADISDGYYGIANSTAWSFIKKKSVNPHENYHFVPGRDHTGNPNGAMLIVNAGGKGNGEAIYENSLSVNMCGNHTYRFSMYVANISAAYLNPKLTLKAVNVKDPENPVELESYEIPEKQVAVWPGSEKNSKGLYTHKERPWTEAHIEFEAQEGDVVKIVITNNCSSGNGNDFAIDDIKLERLDDKQIEEPKIVGELSATNCTPVYSINNMDLLTSWKKIYANIYFLWQYSTDNGYTWTNISEASGIDKMALSREVPAHGKEVYRVVITGAASAAEAKQKAEEIGKNGTPSNGCDYFSISNIISQVDIPEVPKAYVGIDNKQTVTNQPVYDCETTIHRVSLIDALWAKQFTDFSFLWQYSYDEKKWINLDETAKSFIFTDEFEGLTYFRAILAEKAEVAEQVAKNGEPDNKCEKNYFITNSVSIECLNSCVKPEYAAVKDQLSICEDQETVVELEVTQSNKAQVKAINWYLKAEGETEWTLIEGENGETISFDNPKVSTEYLFLAANGKCISDSVKFQLTVNPAISLKEIAPIAICEGKDVDLSATVLTGNPTTFIWNEEEQSNKDFSIENIEEDVVVTLSATDGICVSPIIEAVINVEKIVDMDVDPLPSVICKGESVDLSANLTLSAANSFAWKVDDELITETDLTTTHTPTSNATYTLTVNGIQCEAIVLTMPVKVEEKSSLALNISKSDVCENTEVTLSLVKPSAPAWVWKQKTADDFEYTELDETGESITFNATKSTDFVVVSKNETACKSVESNVVSLSVEKIADVSVTPIPEKVCDGDVVILTANAQLSAANTFKWQKDGNDISSIGIFTTDTPTEDANYALIVSGKECPEIVKNLTTKVEKIADLELLSSTNSVCENGQVTFNLIATNATDWVWERKAEGETTYSELSETGESITLTPEKSATYAVASKGETVCPSVVSNSITVSVEDSIRFTINPLPDTLCIDGSVLLGATVTSGNAKSYEWTRNGKFYDNKLNTTDDNLYDNMNVYTLKVEGNACPAVTKTDSVFQTVKLNPYLEAVDNFICEGSKAELWYSLPTEILPVYEKSADNKNYTEFNILDEAEITQTAGTYYRIKARPASQCPYEYSNVVFVDVEKQPVVEVTPLPEKVCEGETVNLVATGEIPTTCTYGWKKGSAVLTAGQLTATDVLTEDATYTFTVNAKKCLSVEKEVSTKVEKKAALELTASETEVCEGTDVTFTVKGVNLTDWVWERKAEGETTYSDLSETGESITLTPEKSATYAVASKGETVCPSVVSNSITVSVEDSIRFTINSLPDTLCIDGSVLLGATVTSGNAKSYEWTRNGKFYDNKLNTTDDNLYDNMNVYTLKVEGNACPAVTKTDSVFQTVKLNPYLEAVDNFICEGSKAELWYSLPTEILPVYEKSADNKNYTEFNILDEAEITQTAGTYYRIKARPASACPYEYSNVVFVDVEKQPVVEVTPLPEKVCEGETVNLVATGEIPTTCTYGWKKGSAVLTADQLTATDVLTEDATYTFTVNAKKCPSVEKEVSTKVEKKAALELTASETEVCEGTDVTLSVKAVNAPKLVWKRMGQEDSYFKALDETGTTINVKADKSAEYVVTTAGEQVCQSATSNIVAVNVEEMASVKLAEVPSMVCEGEEVLLTASVVYSDQNTFKWLKNNNIFSNSEIKVSDIPEEDATYKFVIEGNQCPSVEAEVTVMVEQKPSIFLSASNSLVCKGDAVELHAVVTNAPSIQWLKKEKGNKDFTSWTALSTTDETFNATDSVVIKAKTNGLKVCDNVVSNEIELNVEQPIEVSIDKVPATICEGATVNLKANVKPNNYGSYGWYKDGNSLALNETSISDNPEGKATYMFVAKPEVCPEVVETVEVDIEHTQHLDLTSSKEVVCRGNEVVLSTNFDYTAGVVWESMGENETQFKQLETGVNEIVVSPVSTSKYRVSATSELGCKQKGNEIEVVVNQPVNLQISDQSICEGETARLIASSENPFEKIEWRAEGTEEVIGETALLSITPENTTTYIATAQNGVCEEEITATVTVVSIPHIISHEDLGNRTYQMVLEDASELVYFNYNNDEGKTTSDILSNVIYGMTYTIQVSNEKGCESYYKLEVPVYDLIFPIYFYQGEENWQVGNLERYQNTSMSIFDRNGKLLFVEKGTTNGWNGEYNGHPMPSTDYWYLVDIPELDKQFTGHFTLLRR